MKTEPPIQTPTQLLRYTDSPVTPSTDTATHPLPLSVLPVRLDSNSQRKTATPTPSAPCFSTGLTGSARRCAKYHRHSRIQGHAKQNEETARMNAVEEKRRRL